MAGVQIMEEVPGDLGGALWLTLRTTTLWAEARAHRGLFAARGWTGRVAMVRHASGEAPELLKPLLQLAELLRRRKGAHSHGFEACVAIAQWGAARGYMAVQADYLHAAGMLAPLEPAAALAAGKAARDLGRFPAAELWFQRAITLARRDQDWDTYCRAHVGIGKLWFRRGRTALAKRSLQRAVRAGIRWNAREAAAMALHDLFNLAFFAKRFEEGLLLARRSAELYGPGHADLPKLAYDVAYQWMEQGEYGRAYPFLREIRPLFSGRHGMVADGGLARAAGFLGMGAEFEAAAYRVSATSDTVPNKSAVFVEVARGALALGEWATAERVLDAAESLASGLKEARTLILVDGLRDEMKGQKGGIGKGPGIRARPFVDPADQELAGFFASVL